ncbi:MAG: SAV_6107 family HEPN domain-containing protein [Ornithinimicrobium sp.]|uniref:SAV_6107 family HEPN domain-containing protein n=1 Tax=Ornithinimicrobium sp. TaxID=1977084 RepID=UPI0026E10A0C|nr:SAV_6107 family HEPN domain-containing protein [Ornithinimicrobium sp.]MDO5740540.1 SAV_6107 family HEPN domain-containing protein [Ornithinimicrobium sp.]
MTTITHNPATQPTTHQVGQRGTQTGPDGPAGQVGAVLDLLDRAREGLLVACHSSTAPERYTQAHLAGLRAGAALLAARSSPSRRTRPRSVWEVLPTVAPELTEWAVFFAESGRRRLALERGVDCVTPRDADDLVRAGERFLELVRSALHLPCATPLPAELIPVGRG